MLRIAVTLEPMDSVQKKSSKTRFTAYLIALLCLGLGLGAYYGSSKNQTHVAQPGALKSAPSFALTTSTGKSVSIRDYKDSVVVIHFWAAWCAPCIPELPEVLASAKKLAKDRNGKPIYWMINSQDETWEQAKKILDESTLPENVISLIDPKAEVSDLLGTYQFPETYVISKKGEIVAKWIGPQEWSGTWGEKALDGIQTLSLQ